MSHVFAVYEGSKEHRAWREWYQANGLFRATQMHGSFTVPTEYPPTNHSEVSNWEHLMDLVSKQSPHGPYTQRKSYNSPKPWAGRPFEGRVA